SVPTGPRVTTNALTVWPVYGWGTPSTAASATAGWLCSTCSTSYGYTLKPLTRITSRNRSTRNRSPSPSAYATSPVDHQPSGPGPPAPSGQYPENRFGPRTTISPGSAPSSSSSSSSGSLPSAATSRTVTPGSGAPIDPG